MRKEGNLIEQSSVECNKLLRNQRIKIYGIKFNEAMDQNEHRTIGVKTTESNNKHRTMEEITIYKGVAELIRVNRTGIYRTGYYGTEQNRMEQTIQKQNRTDHNRI